MDPSHEQLIEDIQWRLKSCKFAFALLTSRRIFISSPSRIYAFCACNSRILVNFSVAEVSVIIFSAALGHYFGMWRWRKLLCETGGIFPSIADTLMMCFLRISGLSSELFNETIAKGQTVDTRIHQLTNFQHFWCGLNSSTKISSCHRSSLDLVLLV